MLSFPGLQKATYDDKGQSLGEHNTVEVLPTALNQLFSSSAGVAEATKRSRID